MVTAYSTLPRSLFSVAALFLTLASSAFAATGPQDAGAEDAAEPEGEVIFVEAPRQAAWLFDKVDRVDFDVTLAPRARRAQAFFDQGLSLLYTGWPIEAERAFLTVIKADPDCPMAFWGIALASADVPVRAAWFARAAWLKRGLAEPKERRLIDALARYYSVIGPDEPADLPEVRSPAPGEESDGVDADSLRRRRRPDEAAAKRLESDYRRALVDQPEVRALLLSQELSRRLAGNEPRTLREATILELDDYCEALLEPLVEERPDHPSQALRVRLWEGRVPPQDVVVLAQRLAESFPAVPELWRRAAVTAGAVKDTKVVLKMLDEAQSAARAHASRLWVEPTEVFGGADIIESGWSLEAPDWSLPDAYGNQVELADFRGRPVLLVNFLGFGCVHCVEQLQVLAPKADLFESQGIEIIAVGTQKPEDLRTSLGTDPKTTGYPFPILCDPDLRQFKDYRAFDDFAEVALHGTYLIDGDGKVLWSDVSHLPYMDIARLADISREALRSAGAAAEKER